jgi:hypothetical protein
MCARHKKSGTFWAKPSQHLYPSASVPSNVEVSVELPLLDSASAKMSELEDVIAS